MDFSHCSRLALQKARSLLGKRPGRIVALHVIDQEFVEKCVRHNLGSEGDVKKELFLHAKTELQDLLREEGMDEEYVEALVCEGIPFLEINKKAVENKAEMIVMGSRGKMGDMETIFFGSTTEKVLRFITRPVLCVPPEEENPKGEII
jgi:nucleotide-binding universal stress UspA family protein